MVGIYKITNNINNKVYIGQSINIIKRWKAHMCNHKTIHNNHLHNAIKKYGIDNFSFEIIKECNKELLNELEVYYINEYNSTNENIGYNVSCGGNSWERKFNDGLTNDERYRIKNRIKIRERQKKYYWEKHREAHLEYYKHYKKGGQR